MLSVPEHFAAMSDRRTRSQSKKSAQLTVYFFYFAKLMIFWFHCSLLLVNVHQDKRTKQRTLHVEILSILFLIKFDLER